MNGRLAELAAYRELLVARAAERRAMLVSQARPLRAPAALADKWMAVAAYVTMHPLMVAATAAVGVAAVTATVAAVWPRRTIKWSSRGWVAWRLLRALMQLKGAR